MRSVNSAIMQIDFMAPDVPLQFEEGADSSTLKETSTVYAASPSNS